MKTIEKIDKCSCLDDNSLSIALCKVHKKPLPIEVIDQELRAAIIAAVMKAKKSDAMYGVGEYRIGLQEILIAIKRRMHVLVINDVSSQIDSEDNFLEMKIFINADVGYTWLRYDLTKSYEDQVEPMKLFLHSVICK